MLTIKYQIKSMWPYISHINKHCFNLFHFNSIYKQAHSEQYRTIKNTRKKVKTVLSSIQQTFRNNFKKSHCKSQNETA